MPDQEEQFQIQLHVVPALLAAREEGSNSASSSLEFMGPEPERVTKKSRERPDQHSEQSDFFHLTAPSLHEVVLLRTPHPLVRAEPDPKT